MASGEQQQFGDTIGIPRPHVKDGFHPLDSDTGVTFREIEQHARERECRVAVYQAHDFFNNNHLLEHVLSDEYEEFMKTLRIHLAHDDVLRFCEMVHRRFLPAASPATCSSVLIVLEKQPGEGLCRRECVTDETLLSQDPGTVLLTMLRQGLGRRHGSFMREALRHMDSPEVKEFVAFCRGHIFAPPAVQSPHGGLYSAPMKKAGPDPPLFWFPAPFLLVLEPSLCEQFMPLNVKGDGE